MDLKNSKFTNVLMFVAAFNIFNYKKLATAADSGKFKQEEFDETASDYLLDEYMMPFIRLFINIFYGVPQTSSVIINKTVSIMKYVLVISGYCWFVKHFYLMLREKRLLRQIVLDDLKLQTKIMDTKLSVLEAKYMERKELLSRSSGRLHRVRARVRSLIAGDEELQRALEAAAKSNGGAAGEDVQVSTTTKEDRELIVQLLKDLKRENIAIPENLQEQREGGEHTQREPNSPENSVYSSLSDVEVKQDCRVKIVKITNVYKVAYLRHYIKQRRLRKVTRQAILKKKMENIKELLDDWQKTLNLVISTSKQSLINMDAIGKCDDGIECTGDYKANFRESSDSENSDLRSNNDLKNNDPSHDEYSLSWTQNPYRRFSFSYDVSDSVPEDAASKEYISEESNDNCDTLQQCECNGPKNSNVLFILPEETSSQMAIEDLKSEIGDEYECHDLISI